MEGGVGSYFVVLTTRALEQQRIAKAQAIAVGRCRQQVRRGAIAVFAYQRQRVLGLRRRSSRARWRGGHFVWAVLVTAFTAHAGAMQVGGGIGRYGDQVAR